MPEEGGGEIEEGTVDVTVCVPTMMSVHVVFVEKGQGGGTNV